MAPPTVGRGEGGTFVATNHTTNYQLNQWEAADQVLRTEFNQDNQKIDTALAGLDSRTEALEAATASLGNCQIHYSTYTGTGSGATNLTFSCPPLFVFISGKTERVTLTLVRGITTAFSYNGNYSMHVNVSWSGNSVSIIQDDGNLGYQCNLKGQTYHVAALMSMGE